MKIIILTTQTSHHAYFVRELTKQHDDIHVMLQTSSLQSSFPVSHPFEIERDQYEIDTLFQGKDIDISQYADCSYHDNINNESALRLVKSKNYDVAIVFGTGMIKTPMIDLMRERIINLHGGDPEYYRGLDSHLWAIYHKDFDNLVTTIHHVNPQLDRGQIILKYDLPVHKDMQLYQLRKINTDVCLLLVQNALDIFSKAGYFPSTKQKMIGRYYSFMPSVLKTICVDNFAKYTASFIS